MKKTIVHLVHPYTYFAEGKNYVTAGGLDNPADIRRNTKVSVFLEDALNSEVPIIHYKPFRRTPKERETHDMPFEDDDEMKIVLDKRIKILWTDEGCTVYRNEWLTNFSEEEKRLVNGGNTSKNTRDLFQGLHTHVFLGGFYALCLKHAIKDFNRKSRKEGEKIYCVNELCVATDYQLRKTRKELSKIPGLEFITFEEAMKFVKPISSLVL